MNAEELIIYIRDCIRKLDESDDKIELEPIIIPTKGDPTKLQDDVTIIVMEQVGDDTTPKFRIDIRDLEAFRNRKHG